MFQERGTKQEMMEGAMNRTVLTQGDDEMESVGWGESDKEEMEKGRNDGDEDGTI